MRRLLSITLVLLVLASGIPGPAVAQDAVREGASVAATTTASATPSTTTAAVNRTVATTSVPDPESGLLSGLASILGWGVVVLGASLVLVNRIAD